VSIARKEFIFFCEALWLHFSKVDNCSIAIHFDSNMNHNVNDWFLEWESIFFINLWFRYQAQSFMIIAFGNQSFCELVLRNLKVSLTVLNLGHHFLLNSFEWMMLSLRRNLLLLIWLCSAKLVHRDCTYNSFCRRSRPFEWRETIFESVFCEMRLRPQKYDLSCYVVSDESFNGFIATPFASREIPLFH
jgi:hypothetical protein